MTDEIWELISQRDELFETNRLDEAKRLWNLVVRRCRDARKAHGPKPVEKFMKSNPKRFHSNVQKLMGQKKIILKSWTKVGTNFDANQVNSFLANICSKHPPLKELPPKEEKMSKIPVITPEEVEKN